MSQVQGLIDGTAAIPSVVLDIAKAARINALAGNGFNGSWPELRKQLKIIQSELDEGHESAEKEDIATLQDDIQDLFFTVAGLAYRAGTLLSAEFDFNAVCESQFTKFDTSYEEWLKTQAKYDGYGMAVEFKQRTDAATGVDYWITYSAVDQLDEKGRNCSKGKWLKSYKFVEPTLADLPAEVVEAHKQSVEALA